MKLFWNMGLETTKKILLPLSCEVSGKTSVQMQGQRTSLQTQDLSPQGLLKGQVLLAQHKPTWLWVRAHNLAMPRTAGT